MKYNISKQRINMIILILGFILSFTLININGFTPVKAQDDSIYDNSIAKFKLSNSPKISIIGNTEFSVQALSNNWLGNGTINNPYIIENLIIVGTQPNSYALRIMNTNVYFVVKNCSFTTTSEGSVGFLLSNVQNGNIYRNSFSSNEYIGIHASGSKYLNISQNTINFNGYGIYLSSTSNSKVFGNLITKNDHTGLYLLTSNQNEIEENTISYNVEAALVLWKSNSNLVTKNTLFDLGELYVHVSLFNTLEYNHINNGRLVFGESSNNSANHNMLGNSNIDFSFSFYNSLTNNSIINLDEQLPSLDSIYFHNSRNNSLTEIFATNSGYYIGVNSQGNIVEIYSLEDNGVTSANNPLVQDPITEPITSSEIESKPISFANPEINSTFNIILLIGALAIIGFAYLTYSSRKRSQSLNNQDQHISNRIICKNCYTKLKTIDMFCFNCGWNIEQQNIDEDIQTSKKADQYLQTSCPGCKFAFNEDDLFCQNCGIERKKFSLNEN